MKKLIAILIVAILAMSASALAATYARDNLTFDYNADFFEITMDDHGDDEDLVILTDKNDGYVRIHLRELDDGEKFPTAQEIAETRGVEVQTLETWGNFRNVLHFELKDEAGATEYVFIAPVYDDDDEIEDILTVNIGGPVIEDEAAAMESSDWTSEVVDTLKVVDD